jgi:phytoene dehydrogenase-like protein
VSRCPRRSPDNANRCQQLAAIDETHLMGRADLTSAAAGPLHPSDRGARHTQPFQPPKRGALRVAELRGAPWPRTADHHTAGIIIAPSLAYMDRAYDDAKREGWSRAPIVKMLIPSTLDDSLAPRGQHVASLFCQQVKPTPRRTTRLRKRAWSALPRPWRRRTPTRASPST